MNTNPTSPPTYTQLTVPTKKISVDEFCCVTNDNFAKSRDFCYRQTEPPTADS